MKLFSRRIAELETKNRILTDAAQRRTQRIEELERELEQIEGIKSDRTFFSDRITQLEERNHRFSDRIAQLEEHNRRLEAEHAFYLKRAGELEEHNRQLTEAATKYASRIQELEREFERIATLIKQDPST